MVLTLVIMIALTLIGIAVVRSSDSVGFVSSTIGFRKSTLNSSDAAIEAAMGWLSNPANVNVLVMDCPSYGYYSYTGTPNPTGGAAPAYYKGRSDYTGTATPSDGSDNIIWQTDTRTANYVTPSTDLNTKLAATADSTSCVNLAVNSQTVSYDANNAAVISSSPMRLVSSPPLADAYGNTSAYVIERMCSLPGTLNGTSQACAVGSSTNSAGASSGTVSYGSYSVSGKTQLYYKITVKTVGPRNSVSYTQAKVLVDN